MKFFFVFAPNNSGTTIMSQYLQSQCDGYLPPFGNFEGQRVPSVAPMMRLDPWNQGQAFDWSFIRSEWQSYGEEAGKSIFVEASPPNIIRVDDIVAEFGADMKAIISISNPYMQIASSAKNYGKQKITKELLEEFAEGWLTKAEHQRRNVERYGNRFPFIKYEEFCRNPEAINQAFGLEASAPASLGGKRNSQVSKVMDMAAKNIAFLTVFETEMVTAVLGRRKDLLDFFDYGLLDFAGYEQMLREQPALAHAGLIDRVRWETKQVKRKRSD
jgi:hypothetical protein